MISWNPMRQRDQQQANQLIDDDSLARPSLKRLNLLLKNVRRGLLAMMALDAISAVIGLIPAIAIGSLVNAFVDRRRTESFVLIGVICLSVIIEALANIGSGGLFTKNAAELYRHIRGEMFTGAQRQHALFPQQRAGLPSLFISDAESIGTAVQFIDSGTLQLVEFLTAIVALSIVFEKALPIVALLLALTWWLTRRSQRPVATASQARQVELEQLTDVLVAEVGERSDSASPARFDAASRRVMGAEIRLGWLQSYNLQGSGGLAKLGPVICVAAVALFGDRQPGSLISIYLLAQRVFLGFDGIVDMSLDAKTMKGAIARCFALIDTPEPASDIEAAAS